MSNYSRDAFSEGISETGHYFMIWQKKTCITLNKKKYLNF